jgi:hypothetical protein
VRLLGRLEAADALVHVPAERPDHADVIVVGHLTVGDDVEAGFLLVADRDMRRILVGLGVVDGLERDADVPAVELVVKPMRPRVGADHGGRQDGVDDLLQGHPGSSSRARRSARGGLRVEVPGFVRFQ